MGPALKARPSSSSGDLRRRLLLSFVIVGIAPVAVLAAAVTTLVARSFEENTARRLDTALRSARARLDALRARADAQVATVADLDLPSLQLPESEDHAMAARLGQQHDLPALEIVDGANRVVSSSHWPAGFGLPDDDGQFPGSDLYRIETAAFGYGSRERLAMMPARAAAWRGRPVTVRGGVFLDDALADMTELTGAQLAIRDTARKRWFPDGTPLAEWTDPPLANAKPHGTVTAGGTSYRWAAAPLLPSLWLVVATPRTLVDVVTLDVGRLTFGVAAVGALIALVSGLLFSSRIAEPVRELAEGARRVAAGDLDARVTPTTADEIGELARAFNLMTEELAASRERLLQAERVAAWREMARRLAHELKNPIFPIQLSIETLRRVLDQTTAGGPPTREAQAQFTALFRESSDTIIDELGALRKIIDEFSDFARMPTPQLRPTDINEVVSQVLRLYQARAAAVTVETDLAPGLPPLPADPDLLGRAIGNLVANALEAMPDGGVLRLRTAGDAEEVTIEVGDTGPGLTDEQKTRLFTPYFTTKKGGTGLGLAIVQGVVSDHGGRVEVKTEADAGTTFRLRLPRRS